MALAQRYTVLEFNQILVNRDFETLFNNNQGIQKRNITSMLLYMIQLEA